MVKETAYFAMGCFWSPQKIFDETSGVLETEVGYMGGDEGSEEMSYEAVCTGKTGHAETVKIVYDSENISYGKLLDIFWANHDATQVNQQGPDVGSQYRSVIFYTTEEQMKLAEASMAQMQRNLDNRAGDKKIATEIVKAGRFYKAEEYHQKYIKKTGKNVC